jgi:hypothetical protein
MTANTTTAENRLAKLGIHLPDAAPRSMKMLIKA